MEYLPHIQFLFGFINQLTLAVVFSVLSVHHRKRIPALLYWTGNLYLQSFAQIFTNHIFINNDLIISSISFILMLSGGFLFYKGLSTFFDYNTRNFWIILTISLTSLLYIVVYSYTDSDLFSKIIGSTSSIVLAVAYIQLILRELSKDKWHFKTLLVLLVLYILFFITFMVRLFALLILSSHNQLVDSPLELIIPSTLFISLLILLAVNFTIIILIQGKIEHDFHVDATEKELLLEQLHEVASHDCLTAIYNRYAMEKLINEFIAEHNWENTCKALLMLDIDQFKYINDTYGHEVGDKVLKIVSTALKEKLNDYESVGRWGGDEFILLLQDTEIAIIYERAKDILISIHQYNWKDEFLHEEENVSLSGGIIIIEEKARKEQVLKAADHFLYEAKLHSRNQIRGKDIVIS